MATVRLYRAPHSTNVERVALALAFKDIEVESVVIAYQDRSPVLAVSDQPLVPVLVDGDLVVADSHAILRHLEARYPDPPLFPATRAARARTDLFLEWFDRVWKLAPNAIEAELALPVLDPSRLAQFGTEIEGHLDLFEALLESAPYLAGQAVGAEDLVAFPFLKFARGRPAADDELFHRILDEHQSLSGRPALTAWIERIDALPRA